MGTRDKVQEKEQVNLKRRVDLQFQGSLSGAWRIETGKAVEADPAS
jgi:hypothetical protein